jgi:probable rRNA maturation factor
MPRLRLQVNSSVALPPRLAKWLRLAARVCEAELPAEVREAQLSLTFCGDKRMRTVNRDHRGKDKTTDVLSFPSQQDLRRNSARDWAAPGILPLGDLLISLPQATHQAKRFGVTLEEEVVHLFFHGFLHVLGWDHERSAREEGLMQAREAALLERFARGRRRQK